MAIKKAEQGIEYLINKGVDCKNGYENISLVANELNIELCFTVEEFLQGYSDFRKMLLNIISEEPMDKAVKAVQFALSETPQHEIEFRFFGSKNWEEETEEWRDDMFYYPDGNLFRLKIFLGLMDAKTHLDEAFLAMAIIICYINTIIKEEKDEFFVNRTGRFSKMSEELHFAAGFDDGKLFGIAMIRES